MSDVSYNITLSPKAEKLLERFGATPELAQAMAGAMDKENQLSVDEVKAKLSGSVLNRVTGRLRDSIGRTDAIVTSTRDHIGIHSKIGSNVAHGGEAVRYAAIHEFGGTITPKDPNGYLRFKTADGAWHSVKKVEMPERSYLHSTVEERMVRYGKRMSQVVIQFLGGNN